MAVLLATQEITGAAKLQVQSSDAETRAQLAEFADSGQAASRDLSQGFIRRDQEISIRPTIGPPDAAAQLIQLRKAVSVRTVHDECVRQRDVETIFNNCRGDQHIEVVMHESSHHRLEFFLAHLAMA